MLALWNLHATSRWSGQWFDHAGNAGPPFDAFNGATPAALYPRVGSGLFVAGYPHWLGQFDALSTAMALPPAWL